MLSSSAVHVKPDERKPTEMLTKPIVLNYGNRLEQGINMVDLMMWLVIAALLLAAALQGIGFYQRASWSYQLKSDSDNMRTYMEGYYAVHSVYPNTTIANASIASGDLNLSGRNYLAHVYVPSETHWQLRICSPDMRDATNNAAGSAVRIYRSDTALYDQAEC